MFPPNAVVAPLTTRSGEIAALNAKVDAGETTPVWSTVPAAGLISYQRTRAPAPPFTVCCVQRPTTEPRVGSTAETAWVMRASLVSISCETPGCGAFAGRV